MSVFRLCMLNIKKISCDIDFWAGIMINVLIYEIAKLISVRYNASGLFLFTFLNSRSYVFISFLTAMIPSAFEFYYDISSNNIRNVLSRITLPQYVSSKVYSATIMTMLSFSFGRIIYFTAYSLRDGFSDSSDIPLDFFLPLYEGKHYVLYIILASMMMSLLSAIIVNVTLIISIIIPNISIICTLPIAIFYFGNQLVGEIFDFTAASDSIMLFGGNLVLFGGRIFHLLFVITMTLLVAAVSERLCLLAFEKRLYGKNNKND